MCCVHGGGWGGLGEVGKVWIGFWNDGIIWIVMIHGCVGAGCGARDDGGGVRNGALWR